jgi:hypothetical protein
VNGSIKRKRPLGLGAFALMLLGVAVLGGIAGGVGGFLGDQAGGYGFAVTTLAICLAMAVGFAACIWWWRGIDEAAREAHKWAWWWGGSAGMGVGGALLIGLSIRAEDLAMPSNFGSTPADIFVSGMMSILLFQLAGYVIAWAGWWLKHR